MIDKNPTTDIIQDKNNAGGPAFPMKNIFEPSAWTGMSLRDYYAGCALLGSFARHGTASNEQIMHIFNRAQAMVNEGIRIDNL